MAVKVQEGNAAIKLKHFKGLTKFTRFHFCLCKNGMHPHNSMVINYIKQQSVCKLYLVTYLFTKRQVLNLSDK